MNLIVDAGNSFVKTAVFQESKLLQKNVGVKSELEINLKKIYSEHPSIEKIIFSNVSHPVYYEKLVPGTDFLVLDAATKLPFHNLYATPETLGNDRKALAAAASKYYPHKDVLIIDAGTCVTFDFKNKNNEYLGGAISPGLYMRYKALNTFTTNLPLIAPSEHVELIGDSTKNSIHSGVIFGMQKEIEGVIAAYQAIYKDLTIIFTGGDAQILSVNLKNGIFANSNFLLEGLNYILEFNKTP